MSMKSFAAYLLIGIAADLRRPTARRRASYICDHPSLLSDVGLTEDTACAQSDLGWKIIDRQLHRPVRRKPVR